VCQQPRGQLLVAGDDGAEHDVGVAREVLRDAVHHHVGTEVEPAGDQRGQEGLVEGEQRATRPRRRRDRRQVGDLEHRVGRRLDPHQVGACGRPDHRGRVGDVDDPQVGEPATADRVAQQVEHAEVGVRRHDHDASRRHQ
jgi:hypothetical protein